jgi:excisionase family DNA binding protein
LPPYSPFGAGPRFPILLIPPKTYLQISIKICAVSCTVKDRIIYLKTEIQFECALFLGVSVAAARAGTTCHEPRDRDQHDHAGAAQPADERLVYTVPEAGRLLGLSRNGSYEAAKRGEIPTIRIGRLLLVPKIPFHRMIELVAPGPTVPAKKSVSEPTQRGGTKSTATGEKGT